MLSRSMSRSSSHTMSRTISIIGAGRVGQTVAKRLHKLGWQIGAVVTRSRQSARAAVRAIGAGTPHASLTPEALDADVILLSVPDDVLANVAQKLAKIGRAALAKKSRAKIVLHTSGALDHRVLAPLARRGVSTGSMHPMQTFSGRSATSPPRRDFFNRRRSSRLCCRAKNRPFARRHAGHHQEPSQARLPRLRYRRCWSRSGSRRIRHSDAPPNRIHPPPCQPSPAPINPPNAG